MSMLWTVIAIVLVLAILAVSHAVTWVRGFDAGKASAGFDALNQRVQEMKAKREKVG